MFTSLGNWDIGSLIAGGAMGAVYHCRNHLVDIEAAIKLVPFTDRTSLGRFRVEVEALFHLGKHPNVVRLLDFGVAPDESTGWIVMEYVKGEPLPERMTEPEVLQMLIQIGGALTQAHQDGIYHRDIKPTNVLRTRDRGFVLIDFGISRKLDGTKLTEIGMFVGTLAYAPPEMVLPGQPSSAQGDAAWDIYALGQLAYERLIGGPVPPTRRENRDLTAVVKFKRQVGALDPSGTCSPGLAMLVREATAPRPEHRLATMSELTARATALSMLDRMGTSIPATSIPSSSIPSSSMPFSRPIAVPSTPLPVPRPAPLSVQGTRGPTSQERPRWAPARPSHEPASASELWRTALRGSLVGFVVTSAILTLLAVQLIVGVASRVRAERATADEPSPRELLLATVKPEPVAEARSTTVPAAPKPEPPVRRPPNVDGGTKVSRMPGSADVTLVSVDGERVPLAPSANVVPGRYELSVSNGSRSASSGWVLVEEGVPVTVTCSAALICRWRTE